jgi:TetR/AcrR family transcriptional regulator
MNRAEQRTATRARIVAAAVDAFAEHGFEGASTRDIAARAEVTQGLVTYHFEAKDELWRAAADEIFRALVDATPSDPPDGASAQREHARDAIRGFVRFSAAHPEMLSFMVDAGRSDDARMRWLIEKHLTPLYVFVRTLVGARGAGGRTGLAPHVYYALAGASSLIFAVPEECVALTGTDPRTKARVERHADLVADLFAP